MTETTRTETQMWAVRLTSRDCVLAEVALEYLAVTYNEWSDGGTPRAAFWAEKANDCITALAHLKERTYMHIEETTAALVCDHCGQPVIVVDGYYKHLDPDEAKDDPERGWHMCCYMTRDWGRTTFCTVSGRRKVPTEATR